MGQAGEKNLAALLKLGEPEAVLAVAYAPGLTDELARRVWWAAQQLYAAEVVGPSRSSEGFRLYYLVRWLSE